MGMNNEKETPVNVGVDFDFQRHLLGTIVFVVVSVCTYQFGLGVSDADLRKGYWLYRDDCEMYPKTRAGYLAPFYGLGCRVGEYFKQELEK